MDQEEEEEEEVVGVDLGPGSEDLPFFRPLLSGQSGPCPRALPRGGGGGGGGAGIPFLGGIRGPTCGCCVGEVGVGRGRKKGSRRRRRCWGAGIYLCLVIMT